MKLKIMMPLLFLVGSASAQLTVTTGAQFLINGDIPITLKNADLINNGIFAGGVNTISFTGNLSSSISGTGTLRFFQLEINKSDNKSVVLQKKIDVVNRVAFLSGFLDLNGFNLDLETSGRVDFEQESSRIVGANGGQVLITTNLNSPIAANPGGLGLFITSDQNLGNVTIRRGHQPQVNGSGLGTTISRYFDIVPDNNTNLNATLGVNYFNAELNGLNENLLEFWQSSDNINWTDIGFTSRDATNNFVNKTGIPSFSRLTLSTVNNPLPVRFIMFNVNCDGHKAYLNWKTALEQNSDYFNIERSPDGFTWTVIGKVPAAHNSSNENNYQFTDINPSENTYYRIAEYDVDGKAQYTNILHTSCSHHDAFTVWPNPVHERLMVNLVVATQSQASLNLFDDKGTLVKAEKTSILSGSNQLSIDMAAFPRGVYFLQVELKDGQTFKKQIVKQ